MSNFMNDVNRVLNLLEALDGEFSRGDFENVPGIDFRGCKKLDCLSVLARAVLEGKSSNFDVRNLMVEYFDGLKPGWRVRCRIVEIRQRPVAKT